MKKIFKNLEDSISALLTEIEEENYVTAVTMGQQVMAEALSAWSKSHGSTQEEMTAAMLLTPAVTAYSTALSASGMALQAFGINLTVIANLTYHEQPIDNTVDYHDIMMQLYLSLWMRLADVLSQLPPSQNEEALEHVHVITMYIGAMLMYYSHNVGRHNHNHELLPVVYEELDRITGFVGHLPYKDIPVGDLKVNPAAPQPLMQDMIARADAIGLLDLSE